MEESKLMGYPSIDKPWLKYYSEEAIHATIPDCTMYEYLWESNKDHLDDIALIYFERKIRYKVLFDRIDEIASAISDCGIKPGDTVSIVSLNTPETICTFYALNKLGVVACMEYATQTPDALLKSLKEVNAKAIFVLDILVEHFETAFRESGISHIIVLPLAASMGFVSKIFVSMKKKSLPRNAKYKTFYEFLHSGTVVPSTPVGGAKTAALMVSTSGTTGAPKKVIHSSMSINSVVFQYQTSGMKFNRGETYLSMAPLFLAFGITLAIHLPLCVGVASIICIDPDAKKTIAMFAKYRPNHFLCGDYHVIEMTVNPALRKMDLSFLRTIAIGGDCLPPEKCETVNHFLQAHFSHNDLITGYGMTELGATAITEMNHVHRLGSVGIPQNKVNVKIADIKTGQELSYGEIGELLIQSPGEMLGYFSTRAEVDEPFVIDETGEKWLHTGDLGKIDRDGFVFIQGRMKRIFRRYVPGTGTIFKLFPDYIEDLLSKHLSVKHCAVICIADKEYIYVPIAFIVPQKEIKGEENELTEYLLTKTVEYNIPVRYIMKEELPLLSNGKVDYRALELEAQKS